jgi:hypothetical protein
VFYRVAKVALIKRLFEQVIDDDPKSPKERNVAWLTGTSAEVYQNHAYFPSMK